MKRKFAFVALICLLLLAKVASAAQQDGDGYDFRGAFKGDFSSEWTLATTKELFGGPGSIYFTDEGLARLRWLRNASADAMRNDPGDPRLWFLVGRAGMIEYVVSAHLLKKEFEGSYSSYEESKEARMKILVDRGLESLRQESVAAYLHALDVDDGAPKYKQLHGLMCAQIAMEGSSTADMQARALRKEMERPYDREDPVEGDDEVWKGYWRIIDAYLDERRYADAAKVVEEMMVKYPGRQSELTSTRDGYLEAAAEQASKPAEEKSAGATAAPATSTVATISRSETTEQPTKVASLTHELSRFWPAIAALGGVLMLMAVGFVVRRRTRATDH